MFFYIDAKYFTFFAALFRIYDNDFSLVYKCFTILRLLKIFYLLKSPNSLNVIED